MGETVQVGQNGKKHICVEGLDHVHVSGNGNGNGKGNGRLDMFDKAKLPDVHAIEDTRGIVIQRVGIDGLHFPLTVNRKDGGTIQTLGNFAMYGSLDKTLKGTNMSRFTEHLLEEMNGSISGRDFPKLLTSLAGRLETQDVYVKAVFDFWMNKTTPVSKKVSPMNYECAFIGQLYNGSLKFVVEANVPVSTYCPCSKAMCMVDDEHGKGAHAQRGIVTIQVITDPSSPGMWLEDVITIAEKSGSAEVYTLLKRPDEKYVTIQGYDNPKFVEDVARDAVAGIQTVSNAVWTKVRVRNYESIHNHNATAYVCSVKRDGVWVPDSKAFF